MAWIAHLDGEARVGTSDPTTPRRSSHRPRLIAASAVLAAPGWVWWAVRRHHGGLSSLVSSLVQTSAILAANVVLTRLNPALKRRGVRLLQKYVINPPVRLLLTLGVLPLGYVLLETTGRVSRRVRRTPVGNGLVGDTLWIVAEHGHFANYVRNIESNPLVRVKVRSGLRSVWREGLARILDDDDPHARQRFLSRWHPLRVLNAAVVRVMGTDLVTVRIDLKG
jgi:deazaflavin-dependent oxidoreductase (nitroreductase family)